MCWKHYEKEITRDRSFDSDFNEAVNQVLQEDINDSCFAFGTFEISLAASFLSVLF